MGTKLGNISVSLAWFALVACLVLLCMRNALASAGGEFTSAPPTVTVSAVTTQARSLLAPPATNANFIVLTPDFAGSVPKAQTANFDPQQFDLGRRTYTQLCATCHGDRGQGLDAWRSSWDPDHQNCAKAGCHGYLHPPDGFLMVKVAPPLIGPNSLARFQNALQLFAFIRGSMPYYAPGSLSDTEYWAVTAYLMDQHGADAFGKPLDEVSAASVLLPTPASPSAVGGG